MFSNHRVALCKKLIYMMPHITAGSVPSTMNTMFLQVLMGQPPTEYYSYFAMRFPRLLLSIFFLVLRSGCVAESVFDKYELTGETDFSGCESVFDASRPSKPTPTPPAPPQVRSNTPSCTLACLLCYQQSSKQRCAEYDAAGPASCVL